MNKSFVSALTESEVYYLVYLFARLFMALQNLKVIHITWRQYRSELVTNYLLSSIYIPSKLYFYKF